MKRQRQKVPALSPVDGVHMHHICITVIVYLHFSMQVTACVLQDGF